MTSDAILLELRSLPAAPDTLRDRVRALPDPAPRWTLPRLDVRRSLLVLAPAVLAVGIGAAVVHGVRDRAPRPVAIDDRVPERASGGVGVASGTVTLPQDAPVYSRAQAHALVRPTALPPSATRLNKYEAWLRVRVPRDRLSRDATRAMQIARGYGGYVASVDMNTPGTRGRAFLVLRVPVTKVEEAVLRLGRLGDVTAQRVRIQDLQRQANQQQHLILQYRTTVAKLEALLAGPLTPGRRIELRYRLARTKELLANMTKAHAGTVREGTLATISTTFYVEKPAAAKPHKRGTVGRTLHSAGGFLVAELAWLLYALIVVAPVALLAFAFVVAARTIRRRGDVRLLESS